MICPECQGFYYQGEPCPTCYHDDLERKFNLAQKKAGNCKACGQKLKYVMVCNSFTVKLKPECECGVKVGGN